MTAAREEWDPQGKPLALWPRYLLLLALALAFLDESLRKVLPGQPVIVTAAKNIPIFLAGAYMLFQGGPFIRGALLMLPWLLYACLSTFYVAMVYHAPLHLLSCFQTYVAGPLLIFLAGMYLAVDDWGRWRAVRLFILGAAAAALVGILQEVARDALPGFLSIRIYRAMHSAAGGQYNESLFASPQTFSLCLLPAAIGLFVYFAAALVRRRWVVLMLLGLFTLGLYLARIRIGMAYLIVGLGAVFALVGYSMGYANAKRARLVGGVALMVCLLGLALSLGYRGWVRAANVNVARDTRFYEVIADPHTLADRFLLPFEEMSYAGGGLTLLGYGAGTAGASARFLSPTQSMTLPTVYDTGLALIATEFGLFGTILFVLPLLWFFMAALARLRAHRPVAPDVIWALITVGILASWFLLKSHSVIENSFSQILWFGSMGIAWGLLVRQRLWAQAGDSADSL